MAELTKEFIETIGLNEEQVKSINGFVQGEIIPNIKKEYDGLANQNAEGILSGASNYAKSIFSVDIERQQGEKYGDYLARIADSGLSKKQEALKIKEAELEEKLKNFSGGEELKLALEQEKIKNDNLLKQNAELEKLKGFDQKYEQASKELSGLKLEVSFSNVKPSFPQTVNKYESEAKWNEFKNGVLEKNTIELIDNVPYAIDKENIHKKTKLSDLVELDINIKELLKGRQQSGNGATSVDVRKIADVPFDVPNNATSEEISTLAREYLVKKLGSNTHPNFGKEFIDLLTKIKTAK